MKKISALAVTALSAMLIACGGKAEKYDMDGERDLEWIVKRDTLRVFTLYGENSFYIEGEDTTGFQYERVKEFAEYLGVTLDITAVYDEKQMVRDLYEGKCDLVAYNIPLFPDGREKYIWCGEKMVTHQVLVQRKGEEQLKNVNDLAGKTVNVLREKHRMRMENLSEEIGGGIDVVKLTSDTLSVDKVFSLISAGQMDYFVYDNDIAEINSSYYSNLDCSLSVGFDQYSYWVVSKYHPKLAEAVDEWSKTYGGPSYEEVMKNFYKTKLVKCIKPFIKDRKKGVISDYDHLFKKYAGQIKWDWRLFAALAYTESKFCPDVISKSGAMGIMQLMPGTLKAFGVSKDRRLDPEQNIRAAAEYIGNLQKVFAKVKDPAQKRLFVIAAYNAGHGHIMDAMALAEKYGKEKYVWDNNVETYLKKEIDSRYFQDPVCKYGYFKGGQTIKFIDSVMANYKAYSVIPE